MATPRLGLVVEDKPTELSCNIQVSLTSTELDEVSVMGPMSRLDVTVA